MIKKDMENPINSGHYFQALCQVDLLVGTFDYYIIDNPMLEKEKDIKEKADIIAEKLAELYQLLGTKDETWK